MARSRGGPRSPGGSPTPSSSSATSGSWAVTSALRWRRPSSAVSCRRRRRAESRHLFPVEVDHAGLASIRGHVEVEPRLALVHKLSTSMGADGDARWAMSARVSSSNPSKICDSGPGPRWSRAGRSTRGPPGLRQAPGNLCKIARPLPGSCTPARSERRAPPGRRWQGHAAAAGCPGGGADRGDGESLATGEREPDDDVVGRRVAGARLPRPSRQRGRSRSSGCRSAGSQKTAGWVKRMSLPTCSAAAVWPWRSASAQCSTRMLPASGCGLAGGVAGRPDGRVAGTQPVVDHDPLVDL